MAVFDYTAVDSAGRMIRGQIEAETRPGAVEALSKQGQLAVEIVPRNATAGRTGASARSAGTPSTEDITLLTRELSLLLGGGLSLSRALTAIEGEADARRVRALAGRLRLAIAAGSGLSEALAAEAPVFSPIYVGMVKAAEASGTLVAVLARIADARDREQKLRAKITSALLYPSMLIATAIATVIVLFVYVCRGSRKVLEIRSRSCRRRRKQCLRSQTCFKPGGKRSGWPLARQCSWVCCWVGRRP
jgi:general secretion pathway protein F